MNDPYQGCSNIFIVKFEKNYIDYFSVNIEVNVSRHVPTKKQAWVTKNRKTSNIEKQLSKWVLIK